MPTEVTATHCCVCCQPFTSKSPEYLVSVEVFLALIALDNTLAEAEDDLKGTTYEIHKVLQFYQQIIIVVI